MKPPPENWRRSLGVETGSPNNHQKTETERATYQDDGGAKWSCLKFMEIPQAKGSTGLGSGMFRGDVPLGGHFGRWQAVKGHVRALTPASSRDIDVRC
jgi:hypothetical protein